MMSEPFTSDEDIAFYTKFRKELDGIRFTRPAAEYDWHEKPDRPISMSDRRMVPFMFYMDLIETMASDLSNAINELASAIRHLKAWEKVTEHLNQRELHHVIVEFIDAEAKYALTLPYSIKSKFIFATSLLSHQANAGKIETWSDDLEPDTKIVQETMDRVASPWSNYKKFKKSLDLLGNAAHRLETNDFRNALTHRFQQDIEIGYTTALERTRMGEATGYEMKQLPPLKIKSIIAALEKEHEKCHKVLELFKPLVNEQISNFKSIQP